MATAGTVPWALLAAANLRWLPSVPWAVPINAFYLWLFWRYARGDGWPKATSETRRTNLRANRISEEVWGLALLAGTLGLVALLLFQRVLNHLVTLPQQQKDDLSQVPVATAVLLVLMASLVAGVVEEASFRGYMQRPIERRHGPVIAIVVNGSLFGLVHFTHPEVGLVLMPYYMGAAAVYGTLAYLTDSIFPGMVLHAAGNVFVIFDLLARGQSEWQASPNPDGSFGISVALFLLVGSAAVGAYVALARCRS